MINIRCVYQKLDKIFSQAPLPEDESHYKNALDWLLRIKPDADINLRIATLGHDIERALHDLKLDVNNFKDYNDFKIAHSKNSANILRNILLECNLKNEDIDDICKLVENHEFGGNPRADYLKIADTLSFFDNNLTHYFKRNTKDKVEERIKWGIERLPKDMRKILLNFNYEDEELDTLFRTILKEYEIVT